MEYEIVCNGKVIAKFQDKCDADGCLDYYEEMYPDCEFAVQAAGR